jgi:hypothetical protein
MSTRWVTPTGWTVEEVVLSGTPNPTRPGDPARHVGPRRYLKAATKGITWHCADVAELNELARRECWDVGTLAPAPTHVVLDTITGHLADRDQAGDPLGRDEALALATEANAAMKPEFAKAHRVYVLAEVEIPTGQLQEAN